MKSLRFPSHYRHLVFVALAAGLLLPSSAKADPGTIIGAAAFAGALGVVVGSLSDEPLSVRDAVQESVNNRRRGPKPIQVAYPVYQPTAFVPANTPSAAVYSAVPPARPHEEDLYGKQAVVYVPHYMR